ncbi:MAG: sulfotransferase domain-containing protein [Actinomycetia bacterium]|nr:sulfotransferase domain-containing protein [Actinomycetes bacterium]
MEDMVQERQLPEFARAQMWPINDVADQVEQAMLAFPARRRVRSLELAAILSASMPTSNDRESTIRRQVLTSLRTQPQVAFVVENPVVVVGEKGRPLVLASSPRCGNTLLHRLIASALGHRIVAAHTVDDLDPSGLAGNVLLQIHAPATEVTRRLVSLIGAEVITIARHPLDILLSVLHFSRNEQQVRYWVGGHCLPPHEHFGRLAPLSEEFLEWAEGPGANRLLSVSQSWWTQPRAHRIRYEELVSNPLIVVEKLAASLGKPLEDVERLGQVATERVTSSNNHQWRGKPGVWRELLTAEAANRIRRANPTLFAELGYDTDEPTATPDEANQRGEALKR